MELYKRYIDVVLIQHKNGKTEPLFICWDDGRKYRIEKVLEISRRTSPVGGGGTRYVCLIQGQKRNIFLEKDKWFIESRQP